MVTEVGPIGPPRTAGHERDSRHVPVLLHFHVGAHALVLDAVGGLGGRALIRIQETLERFHVRNVDQQASLIRFLRVLEDANLGHAMLREELVMAKLAGKLAVLRKLGMGPEIARSSSPVLFRPIDNLIAIQQGFGEKTTGLAP